MGDRRLLFVLAEGARRALGVGAGRVLEARARSARDLPQLLSRPRAARGLLAAAEVSPHDFRAARLCLARRARGSDRRRSRESLAAARARASRVRERARSGRAVAAAARGRAAVEPQRRPRAGRRRTRRPFGPQLRQRDAIEIGAGSGAARGQNLARRPDGVRRLVTQRRAPHGGVDRSARVRRRLGLAPSLL